ncbi:hypothetical protein FACS1894217_14000 [Clostridia bacterium]|nr:hypothetical protein FACS1894217_14000 [Clostridia bacterium]
MQERLTPQRAAELIQSRYKTHITPQALSAWIKTGRCTFGEYLRKQGGQRGMFLIFPDRLDEYFRLVGGLAQRPIDLMYYSAYRPNGGSIYG